MFWGHLKLNCPERTNLGPSENGAEAGPNLEPVQNGTHTNHGTLIILRELSLGYVDNYCVAPVTYVPTEPDEEEIFQDHIAPGLTYDRYLKWSASQVNIQSSGISVPNPIQ